MKTVIAIDFDLTASEHPHKVNILYEDAHNFIVIYTSRSSSIRKETEKELADLGIKYHALVMDKLRADIYIDDKNMGGLQWP
jgi:pyruvate/2-oxoacid:ferredoxin oxidoreductase alpha subunit